jgi:hypothetical protein
VKNIELTRLTNAALVRLRFPPKLNDGFGSQGGALPATWMIDPLYQQKAHQNRTVIRTVDFPPWKSLDISDSTMTTSAL